MEVQLDTVMKRARGYWLVDGFAETITGVLLILVGAIPLLRGITGPDSLFGQFISIAGDIAIIKVFGIIAAVMLIWWLKDRFTYPRTGFVRGKVWTVAQILPFLRNVLLVLILPVLGLLTAFFFLTPLRGALFSMPIWLPVFLGLLWGALCLLAGERLGLRRFRILGVVILLIGISVSIWQLTIGVPSFPAEALQANPWGALPEVLRSPIEESIYRVVVGACAVTLISGAALTISGLVTFLRYRKENPVPYKDES